MKNRKMLIGVVVLLLLAYALVAVSPLKKTIGRNHPGVASLFGPPLFNFSASYDSGSVLGFDVNSAQQDVIERLRSVYAGKSNLLVNCAVTHADSIVPITQELDIAATYGGGKKICVSLDGGRLLLDFMFRATTVSSIELAYLRTEGP
jgi:hypothetical protein